MGKELNLTDILPTNKAWNPLKFNFLDKLTGLRMVLCSVGMQNRIMI